VIDFGMDLREELSDMQHKLNLYNVFFFFFFLIEKQNKTAWSKEKTGIL
jgi:hypothetical protein